MKPTKKQKRRSDVDKEKREPASASASHKTFELLLWRAWSVLFFDFLPGILFRFCFCSGKEDPKDSPRELGGISFFFFSGILVLFSRKKEDPKDKGPGPGLGVLLTFK